MRVAAHDPVDGRAHLRVVVLDVVVEHGDHDVGLAGVFERLGHRVDLGNRVVERQPRRGARAELVGHVARDGPDEGDSDAGGRRPYHFVAKVPAHAVHVRAEVRESDLRVPSCSVDAMLEDVDAEVELVVADRRGHGFELVERRDGRIVLQRAGCEGRGSDVVAEQREGGVAVGGAGLVEVAADRRNAGFGDGPVLARLLDVAVDVGQVVQIESHGSIRLGGRVRARGRRRICTRDGSRARGRGTRVRGGGLGNPRLRRLSMRRLRRRRLVRRPAIRGNLRIGGAPGGSAPVGVSRNRCNQQ